jgi:integrase
MAYFGLRPSEVAALRMDSIDWHPGTLKVEQRKTRSTLILPLASPTLHLFRRYRQLGRADGDLPSLFLRTLSPTGYREGPRTCGSASAAHTKVCPHSQLTIHRDPSSTGAAFPNEASQIVAPHLPALLGQPLLSTTPDNAEVIAGLAPPPRYHQVWTMTLRYTSLNFHGPELT